MRIRQLLPIAAALCSLAAPAAKAAVVVESLPYMNTPDWVDFQFDGWTTTNGAGESVLHTAYGGNWFGWGAGYGQSTPWEPGDNATGNLLRLTTRFTEGSRDWSAYLADGAGYAVMNFNPTGCDGNVMDCRQAAYSQGIEFYFGDADDPNASSLSSGSRILVIGDGSGSTQTGYGDMIVHAVSLDNAPDPNVVLGVPEPASWAMMLTGFGLVGSAMRRRARIALPA